MATMQTISRVLIAVILSCAPAAAQFAITWPSEAATVSGALPFTVQNAPAGTSHVEYIFDGWRIAGVADRPPFNFTVADGTEYMDGFRTVTAKAYGAAGTVLGTSAGVGFTLNNFGGTGFSFSLSGSSGTVELSFTGTPAGPPTTRTWCFVEGQYSPDVSFDLNDGSVPKTDLFDTTNDWIIWENGHNIATGDPIYYQAGVASTPLTANTTYYAVVVDRFKFRLATSRANALAGTYINLTAFGTGTQKFNHRPFGQRWFIQDTTPATIDTTKIRNGQHLFVCNVWSSATTNTQVDSVLGNPVTTFSQLATISNGTVPMELRAAARVHLVTGGTHSLAPYMANTDGSTTALTATDVYYFSSNTSVATVSGSGVVTGVAPGRAFIRLRYNETHSFDLPVDVRATAGFPHFGRDGTILTTYDPDSSMFLRSVFLLGSGSLDVDPRYDEWTAKSAINTMQEGLPTDVWTQTTEAGFLTAWNNALAPIETRLAAHPEWGTYWTLDNIFSSSGGVGLGGPRGLAASAVTQANFATALTDIAATGRGTAANVKDEVDGTYRSGPHPVSTWDATNFTSIAVAADGTATATFKQQPWSANVLLTGSSNGGNGVCITGATSAGLNGCHFILSTSRFTFTFGKVAAAEGTYNSGTDANLRLTYWQGYQKENTVTVTASSGTCSVALTNHGYTVGRNFGIRNSSGFTDTDLRNFFVVATVPDANNFTFACPLVSDGSYSSMILRLMWNPPIPHNLFTLVRAQLDAVPGSAPMAAPLEGRSGNSQFALWNGTEGGAGFTDFDEDYNTISGNLGDPSGHPGGVVQQRYLHPTQRHEVLHINHPRVDLVSAVWGDYEKQAAGDWPRWDVDLRFAIGDAPADIALAPWALIAQGSAGLRYYTWEKPDEQASRLSLGIGSNTSVGINPLWTLEHWRAMGLANNLIDRLESLCLSRQIAPPYYGRKYVTGARQSATELMLVIASFSEIPESLTVDLEQFAYEGGSVSRYILNDKRISVSAETGSTDTVTIGPRSTVVYVFHSGASPLRTYRATRPLASGAASIAMRYGYWDDGLTENGDAVDCGSEACSVTYDPQLGRFYGMFLHRASGGEIIVRSAVERLH